MKRTARIMAAILMCTMFMGYSNIFAMDSEDLKERKITMRSIGERSSVEKIRDLVQHQEHCVNEKLKEEYMETISTLESEYVWEKKHWFEDIIQGDITEYSLKIISIEEMESEEYLVKLEQSYVYNHKKYSIEYENIYSILDGRAYDCDLNFKEFETEHFIVKYTGASIKKSWLSKSFEEAYKIATDRIGLSLDDKMIMKLYDDSEVMRQSFKLTFAWEAAGWYEYPESIKFIKMHRNRGFKYGIAHELIHRITIEKSGNNMPYWFSEGIAVYYSRFSDDNIIQQWNIPLSSLEEMDLEHLDQRFVHLFYNNSAYFVKKFIDLYGEDTLMELLDELKKYGLENRTAGEAYHQSNERFKDSIEKVLEINFHQLCKELERR